jgi:GAG-pre-integrase domain
MKGSQFTKIIIHNEKSSVPMFLTKPTLKQYRRFQQRDNNKDECSLAIALAAQHFTEAEPIREYASNDVRHQEQIATNSTEESLDVTNEGEPQQGEEISLRNIPVEVDFHDVKPPEDDKGQEEDEFKNMEPKTLKLLWHYRLGHLPFSAINRMSKKGELPKKLCNSPDPMCTACIYGRMTKRPWRTRADPTSKHT